MATNTAYNMPGMGASPGGGVGCGGWGAAHKPVETITTINTTINLGNRAIQYV